MVNNPPADLPVLVNGYHSQLSDLLDKHAPIKERTTTLRIVFTLLILFIDIFIVFCFVTNVFCYLILILQFSLRATSYSVEALSRVTLVK